MNVLAVFDTRNRNTSKQRSCTVSWNDINDIIQLVCIIIYTTKCVLYIPRITRSELDFPRPSQSKRYRWNLYASGISCRIISRTWSTKIIIIILWRIRAYYCRPPVILLPYRPVAPSDHSHSHAVIM